MDKENVVYIPSGLSSSHKEERNHGVCRKMIETEDHRIMWSKPSSDRQRSHVLSYMWNLDINYTQKYIHTHIYTNTHTYIYIYKHAYIQKCIYNGQTVWRGREEEKDGREQSQNT
jgi:hypothetical protein